MNRKEIQKKLKDTKAKISKIDVLISSIRGADLAPIEDDHIPSFGQPYFYGVKGSDGQDGILIPAGETGVFSGTIRMESDSSFLCTDLLGAEEILNTNAGLVGLASDNNMFKSMSRNMQSFRYSSVFFTDFALGHDLGFKIYDEGTGRKLFQAVEDPQKTFDGGGTLLGPVRGEPLVEPFIPGRVLQSGLPWTPFLGPNYVGSLDAEHIFAKNTAIRIEVIAYQDIKANDGEPDDSRVFITMCGFKIFGD